MSGMETGAGAPSGVTPLLYLSVALTYPVAALPVHHLPALAQVLLVLLNTTAWSGLLPGWRALAVRAARFTEISAVT